VYGPVDGVGTLHGWWYRVDMAAVCRSVVGMHDIVWVWAACAEGVSRQIVEGAVGRVAQRREQLWVCGQRPGGHVWIEGRTRETMPATSAGRDGGEKQRGRRAAGSSMSA
jgi:hypothetical protein